MMGINLFSGHTMQCMYKYILLVITERDADSYQPIQVNEGMHDLAFIHLGRIGRCHIAHCSMIWNPLELGNVIVSLIPTTRVLEYHDLL